MKIFKPYWQNQLLLLPPNLEDLIPEGHLVRFINDIVNRMDLSELYANYKGGGATAYNPSMMLKVLIYGYMNNVRTSRKLAKAIRENIVYMWLAGMQTPDFRTINNFRSSRLKEDIDDIFRQVVEEAADVGLVKFENFFVDGTKIEANSNKHKMVWRKNTERYKASVKEKIDELLGEIDRLNEEENRLYGDKDLPEVGEGLNFEDPDTKAMVEKRAKKINKLLKKKKSVEKKLNSLEDRKKKYEHQEEVSGGRNSYSKTDTDASAMMMKDGQIKPGYNFMIGCENQVIVSYDVFQNANDGTCFKDLMERVKEFYGKFPVNVCGDSIFGNEENYDYCDNNEVTPYLKYQTYHAEKKRSFLKNRFRKENFIYDDENDEYICPEGKILNFVGQGERKTKTGYAQTVRTYSCDECAGCPFRSECTRGENRVITCNDRFAKYKANARDLLDSPFGEELRKRRGVEVETPFGNLKQNHFFRRFLLRGKEKVKIEGGLMSIAHNIKKIVGKVVSDILRGGEDILGFKKKSDLYSIASSCVA